MRKCPDCAEENLFESLFCKHCGRCLLAPDPIKGQRLTATHIEHPKTPEVIDFFDGHIVKNSSFARLKIRHRTGLSVYGILLLNLLVVILMSEIIVILMSQ